MNIEEILRSTDHRLRPIPTNSWSYYQEWNNAIFLHWEVELSELKKHVPKELQIDTFQGKPWVSVVAFTMEKIRPKNLPYFNPISNFHEINIRTYVKANGKTGVYFLSIEAAKRVSCFVARKISNLPYRYSKIKRSFNTFESHNNQHNEHLKINFSIKKEQVEKTSLDSWLTERYALFQEHRNQINEFEIHHLAWPLYSIKMNAIDLNYPRFDRLLNGQPHKISYSKGVKVLSWWEKQLPPINF